MGRDRRCSEFEAQHPRIRQDAAPPERTMQRIHLCLQARPKQGLPQAAMISADMTVSCQAR